MIFMLIKAKFKNFSEENKIMPDSLFYPLQGILPLAVPSPSGVGVCVCVRVCVCVCVCDHRRPILIRSQSK